MVYKICPDVMIHYRDGNCLISNPRARTHIIIRGLIPDLSGKGDADYWIDLFKQNAIQDATQDYYGKYGLHGDHTGIKINDCDYTQQKLFDLLQKRWILVESDMNNYHAMNAPLQSILDNNNLGSFHQKVGQYLTVDLRLKDNRWKWWHDQKYTEDGTQVLSGPYKDIQEAFMKSYFTKSKIDGLKILDFGCGNGFYSNHFKIMGADVIGLDTSKNLIDMARDNFQDIEFVHVETEEDGVNFVKDNKDGFDIIFMQDVLLLLLQPEDEKELMKLNELLDVFHAGLKDNGRLCAIEPNGTFFLCGRYGNPKNPYAVVTEYQDPVFNIAPRLPVVLNRMSEAGFALSHYDHPKHTQPSDPGHNFVNEFCTWDYMEFAPLKK